MSLQSIYERFLADSSASALSPNVALNYITTTTSFQGVEAVTKHLTTQARVVKKKSDKTLSAVEAPSALVLEVETTLEFVTGGGAYLPSLDDNFLADRIVTFPLIHIVRFDSSKRIESVRQYWDQGSLLKQCEVIGSRGRNWPIRDAHEQTRLILLHATEYASSAQGRVTPTQSKPSVQPEESTQSLTSPNKRYVKDPHTSLSLFGEPAEDEPSSPPAIAPRAQASAKPPPRPYNEIFVGEEDNETTPTKKSDTAVAPKIGSSKHYRPSRIFDDTADDQPESAVPPKIGSSKHYRPSRIFDDTADDQPESVLSPKAGSSKNYRPSRIFEDTAEELPQSVVSPKAGSSKNYQPIRLFDVDEPNQALSKEKTDAHYKSDPRKYQHFELGDDAGTGEKETKSVPSRPKSQHASQWEFYDFATPEKPGNKVRGQDVRHFGWSDDEAEAAQPSPPQRPHVPQPRRDAETHFQFADDGAEVTPGVQRSIGAAHNKGLGLYENNLYDEEGNPTPRETSALNEPVGVHPSGSHREKDFGSHWSMTDTPAPGEEQTLPRPPTGDHSKAVKMMDSSWDTYDESSQPENDMPPPTQGKRQSRNPNQRSWGFGDEGDF